MEHRKSRAFAKKGSRLWFLLAWTLWNGGVRGEDVPMADYFRAETARVAAQPLAGIGSLDAWKAKRPELQRQLREMLGLDPLPDRTDLRVRITGTFETPEFVVEKILYQASPGLYVTGNLYRPRSVPQPAPAILYVCGHAQVEKNGVIFGNKTHYQHHAAWYAANGYVCFVLDTLQLGELAGLHHGTYRQGMWWWQSRGYTPAGIEAWNAIRAIDYLSTRSEVDPRRIGVTGRSGGGATTWWVGALDDRVAAVVPVAGITDLQDHVVDGVVEGHCDCMYYHNTYRWDFTLLAALVAPKPLLVENTNHDPIFPEDGVRRIFKTLENVYQWYGASDRLGLVIGQGGHVDSQEIRHPSFAFMNQWLKGTETKIEEPDRHIAMESLKVLAINERPPGERNSTVHETFVPQATLPAVPKTVEELTRDQTQWLSDVKRLVFAGWPRDSDVVPLEVKLEKDGLDEGNRLRAFAYTSQEGIRLKLWVATREGTHKPKTWRVHVALTTDWLQDVTIPELRKSFGGPADDEALVVVTPRGVGFEGQGPKKDAHIRRRFALLGQTLAGMQVWDIRRALASLRTLEEFDASTPLSLEGERQGASVALWAAVFEPIVDVVRLEDPPATVRDGPAFFSLDRVLTMPQAVALVAPRHVHIVTHDRSPWRWDLDLKENLGPATSWFDLSDRP